jgi:DNA (cytosine-5)-methyltransferase 1
VSAYYNEMEPYAAQWLRNLIDKGLIAKGEVDERSILDVAPADLRGFTQCHFFAGIGGWSLAARLAGWPDERPLWTGSAPCQPFSTAGQQKGTADERHLWPVFFNRIRACRPFVVMGEQVAAAVGKDWLDGVCADLEGIGYACGAVVVPACAVNAPH